MLSLPVRRLKSWFPLCLAAALVAAQLLGAAHLAAHQSGGDSDACIVCAHAGQLDSAALDTIAAAVEPQPFVLHETGKASAPHGTPTIELQARGPPSPEKILPAIRP